MTDDARLSPTYKRSALLLIVLLAAFLRLYRIADLPPGDGYDPAWYGVDALDILQGNLPVYLPTNIGREAMFSYIVALCVAVTGIGPHAIHLASALIGILTVPATYLVADTLFAKEDGHLRDYGGLLSALMLAASFLAGTTMLTRGSGGRVAPTRVTSRTRPIGVRYRQSSPPASSFVRPR